MNKECSVATTSFVETENRLLKTKIAALEAVVADLPSIVIVHNLHLQDVVYMSPKGREILGVTLDELKAMGSNYHQRFFNPEDLEDYKPKVVALLERNDENEFITLFQQVRPSEKHDWSWYLTTSKIFLKDNEGNPSHFISFATPVDPLHHITHKVNRLLEENNFFRHNQKKMASLTNREKDVLRLIALGETAEGIACKLYISEKTAKTHRRNIKAKLNAQSAYDIMKFAQAFDLI